MITDLSQINIKTDEGKLALAAISLLWHNCMTDNSLEEILKECNGLARNYTSDGSAEWNFEFGKRILLQNEVMELEIPVQSGVNEIMSKLNLILEHLKKDEHGLYVNAPNYAEVKKDIEGAITE